MEFVNKKSQFCVLFLQTHHHLYVEKEIPKPKNDPGIVNPTKNYSNVYDVVIFSVTLKYP